MSWHACGTTLLPGMAAQSIYVRMRRARELVPSPGLIAHKFPVLSTLAAADGLPPDLDVAVLVASSSRTDGRALLAVQQHSLVRRGRSSRIAVASMGCCISLLYRSARSSKTAVNLILASDHQLGNWLRQTRLDNLVDGIGDSLQIRRDIAGDRNGEVLPVDEINVDRRLLLLIFNEHEQGVHLSGGIVL
jgi:hypothetical protein